MNALFPSREPTVAEYERSFQRDLIKILLLLLVIWTVKIYETLAGHSLSNYGLYPRDPEKLYGIVTMVFLHKDFPHLYANSTGLLMLGVALYQFYPRVANRVMLYGALLAGVMTWCFGRASFHIGASGLLYVLTAYLFFSGILRRDRASVGIMLITAFLYGSAIWGVLPIHPGISWEGHLSGGIAGFLLAVRYRKVDLPPKEIAEEEDARGRRFDPDRVRDVYRDPYGAPDYDDDYQDAYDDPDEPYDEYDDTLHFQDQMYDNKRFRS